MDQEEFQKKMENLKAPGAEVSGPQNVRLAILHAERSAAIGVWLIVVPCFFLACVVMKYFFQIRLGLIGTFEDVVGGLGRNPGTRWIQPVLFMALPIVSIVLNALAIMHFRLESAAKSIVITVKLRWLNVILIVISITIVAIFALYLISENIQPHTGH